MRTPPGTLRTTDRLRDVLPSAERVGDFKAATLARFKDAGLVVFAACGNAETHVHAYGKAGVPKARTFIVGARAGTRAVRGGWAEHLTRVRAQSDAE